MLTYLVLNFFVKSFDFEILTVVFVFAFVPFFFVWSIVCVSWFTCVVVCGVLLVHFRLLCVRRPKTLKKSDTRHRRRDREHIERERESEKIERKRKCETRDLPLLKCPTHYSQKSKHFEFLSKIPIFVTCWNSKILNSDINSAPRVQNDEIQLNI